MNNFWGIIRFSWHSITFNCINIVGSLIYAGLLLKFYGIKKKKNQVVVSCNSNNAIVIQGKKDLLGMIGWNECCGEVIRGRDAVLRIHFAIWSSS